MFTTPQRMSGMRGDALLPALRSTRSAQAWGTLAAYLRPNGMVQVSMDTLLMDLVAHTLTGTGEQEVAFGWYARRDGGCDLLFLYPDQGALVARTTAGNTLMEAVFGRNRDSWNATEALQGHQAVFSPVILRGNRLHPNSRPGQRLRFPHVALFEQHHALLAQKVGQAVADIDTVGAVHAPWHASLGDVAAPWAIKGHGLPRGRLMDDAALCVQGLLLAHQTDPNEVLRFKVLGLTLDDKGQPVFEPCHLRLIVHQAGTYGPIERPLQDAFMAWMVHAWNHPKAPWDGRDWFAPALDEHSRLGQGKARRVPIALFGQDLAPTSAHARMAAVAAYHSSLAW